MNKNKDISTGNDGMSFSSSFLPPFPVEVDMVGLVLIASTLGLGLGRVETMVGATVGVEEGVMIVEGEDMEMTDPHTRLQVFVG
jgi:hypothetical protein